MLGGASSKGQSKGGRREEAYRLRKRSYFPDEIDEARLGDNVGIPAEVALNQIVGFDDVRAGQGIAARVAIAPHQPEVVGDGRGGATKRSSGWRRECAGHD